MPYTKGYLNYIFILDQLKVNSKGIGQRYRMTRTGNRHRINRRRGFTFRTFGDFLRGRGNRHVVRPRFSDKSVDDGRKPRIEKPEPAPPVQPDLNIEDVNLNILSNSKEHHTNEYSITENGRHLIVRRGQHFDISIEFNKKYDPKTDDLKLVFLAGDDPRQTKGTRISLILSDRDVDKKWGAWIRKNEEKMLSVRINTPPTCYVGVWKLQVETIKKADNKNIIFEYTHDQVIYVLFNPWCEDDQVYQPDNSLLEEYVLNDTGKIYVGNRKQIHGRKWNFGQFEENVLDCALYMLDNNVYSWTIRGDPVKMSRKLSAVTNDDVLVGNWSGDYEGGKSPLHWVGSVAILNEYFKTKKPVCYGQCWVFSGLLTTLCRSLGIPARSVTNFASAHDCDGSISIDSYFDESGEPIEELNEDSVWNFHVWNDVWMSRPDLPNGYGGWQAVDATPQELSDGIYQCGPAPLEAIKRGEVYLPYDTPFVFAEVNADRVNWQVEDNDELTNIGINKSSVGVRMSTKIPKGKPLGHYEFFSYDRQREDVTDQYKYKEGSEEERTAVIRANQDSTKKGLYDEGKQSDVDFELMDKEMVPYGNDFELILKINNKSDAQRTISGCLCTSSMYYTGVPASKVKMLSINREQIPAKSSKELSLKVTFDEYYESLVDQCHMKMSCMCKVMETKHIYVDQDTFRLVKPEITIKVPSTGKVGEKIKADLSFTNPLPCALTKCELTVEGPGLQDTIVTPQSIVKSKQTFMMTIEFLPRKTGTKDLIVSFNSKELAMVEGSCEITIAE